MGRTSPALQVYHCYRSQCCGVITPESRRPPGWLVRPVARKAAEPVAPEGDRPRAVGVVAEKRALADLPALSDGRLRTGWSLLASPLHR